MLYPNWWLNSLPAPFLDQPDSSLRGSALDVMTTRYCISLHVRLGLASRARAVTAAAMGALALVPVCSVVQMWSGLSRASWSTVVMLPSRPGVPEL